MKKYLSTIIVLLFLVTMISCKKWVDVKPVTEKDRDELINSNNGFKQMLYGVYLGMTDMSLYGQQLTYGFTEAMVYNQYFLSSQNAFVRWDYLSTTIRPTIDAVWSSMYNNIANVNSILKDIDNKKSLFSDQEYKMIKGEMLAARAYQHFDLLRLFGPVYLIKKDSTAIPYVQSYERVRYPHLKATEVADKILADLDSAQTLLQGNIDPILTSGLTNGQDRFLANRQYRFNYWAVIASKARVYMYINDKEKAALYANKVITEGPFRFVNPSTLQGDYADVLFMPEIICALNVSKLATYYSTYFASGLYKVANGSSSYASRIFDDLNDYRFLYQLTTDSYGNRTISCKYRQNINTTSSIKQQTIPLLRLGEMYLIAAECAIGTDKTKAISLVRELRFRRGYLSVDRSVSDNITDAQLATLITKEFRKETYMEGQTFYNYKRLNQVIIPALFSFFGEPTAGPVNFKLPIPESEKEFGLIP